MSLHSVTIGETGSPAVFLHGLFGNGRNFTRIARGLQPEIRARLVDLPNHGRSPWTDRFDYVTQADLIAEHLHGPWATGEPVDVVGHSMGGKVAMVLATRHPHLVHRLVVVDIAPVRRSPAEFEHIFDSLLALDLSTISTRQQADARLATMIRSRRVRGVLLQNLRPNGDGFRWRINLPVLRRDVARITGFPDVGEARFDGPVLWVTGETSSYVQPDDATAMRQLFPRVRRVTVKGAGHWVYSEQPETFTRVLRAFLAPEPK